MDVLTFLPGALLGFTAFSLTSHPKAYVRRRLPQIKLKRIQILPTIRIHVKKDKVIHFHHWFNFTILFLVSVYASGGFIDAMFTKGFLIGGIIQGLSLPEANKIIYSIKQPN